jgi:hypothetical protein
MAGEKFKSELLAYQAFSRLLEQAEACADAFRNASIDVPEPLKRLLAEEVAERVDDAQLSIIPPIKRDHTPTRAGKEWISIPVRECTATTVTLAVLEKAGIPMRSRDVKDGVIGLLPSATDAVVANIGTRLRDSTIRIDDEGWSLSDLNNAAILDGDYLWGPPSVFQKQEIAAHRREAIILVLERYPSGLQIVQIVDELRRLGWVKAPINKDLVKDDVQKLAEAGKIRRRGNSGKWEISREERAT